MMIKIDPIMGKMQLDRRTWTEQLGWGVYSILCMYVRQYPKVLKLGAIILLYKNHEINRETPSLVRVSFGA